MFDYPVFFDTEFTGWSDTGLISIGLVDQSGKREFYAELIDPLYTRDCSEFVRVEVLPHLQGGAFLMPTEVCRARLKAFIEAVDVAVVQLVCDLPSYDWMLFRRLMGEEWPANLSRHAHTFDPGSDGLPQRARTEACAARARYFSDGNPCHHALHDAKSLRVAWIAALDCSWHPGSPAKM